jgi:SpoVK/Ycf46/Vps4 family AAA+-type ATPase
MPQSSLSQVLLEKFKAGYPALYLLSAEDMRSQREIKRAAKQQERKVFIWTYEKGLVYDDAKPSKDGIVFPVPDTGEPKQALMAIVDDETIPPKSVVILRLFHHFLPHPDVQSQLLDIIPVLKATGRTLIILTPVLAIPAEVEKEIALIESSLPGHDDMRVLIDGMIEGSPNLKKHKTLSEERRNLLIKNALGLTTTEAENALSLSVVRPVLRDEPEKIWDADVVMEEKCQALKKTGLLEYIPSTETMSDIGGMELLKKWVSRRKKSFTKEAREFGVPAPKGLLLVGPPGSGKSMGAKAVASELGVPLLKCDIGRLFGGLVGQSEANVRTALQTAEAVAPCVLWIDEIEKGLAGASGQSLDSGVGQRVFGTILTWMQEKTSPVFVYATANDVTGLPPELLRKGRFDELFSILLPGESERKEIFEIHVRKKSRTHLIGPNPLLDIEHYAKWAEGFSGAEIEAAINEALYVAFDEGREINFMDVQDAIDASQPLIKVMPEKLMDLQKWCQKHTRPANASDVNVKVLLQNRRLIDIN